ncbi:MAG TPA: hypothetical protein VFF43_08850, partial [Caldimonas sp.]|nr:hypothetical protein [Caldimonas sp.]
MVEAHAECGSASAFDLGRDLRRRERPRHGNGCERSARRGTGSSGERGDLTEVRRIDACRRRDALAGSDRAFTLDVRERQRDDDIAHRHDAAVGIDGARCGLDRDFADVSVVHRDLR